MRPGWSLDLTTNDPETGEAWDLGDGKVRTKVVKLIQEGKPYMLVCSPMCTAFSAIQALNADRRDPAVVRRELEGAKDHVRWVMKIRTLQLREGRYFLFEHPRSATSWKMPEVEKVAGMDGVEKVRTDMCRFGMQSKDEQGIGLVKKSTTMMTNSPEVAKRLAKKCLNENLEEKERHRHVQLMNGRAKNAQVYPRGLCRAVCEGVAAQKQLDSRNLVMMDLMTLDEMNSFGADGLHDQPDQSDGMVAFDDVTDESLVPKLVMAARAE